MSALDPDPRVVIVRRSGGFAGISRSWAMDLTDADATVVGQVRALAARAAGGDAATPAPGSAGTVPADGFRYEVTVESAAGSALVQASDPGVPPALAALVDLVRVHGRPV